MDPAKQQQQKPASSKPRLEAAARPKHAYSVAPTSTRRSSPVVKRLKPEEVAIQPVQQLDDPQLWPCLPDTLISKEDSTGAENLPVGWPHQHPSSAAVQNVEGPAKTQTTNLFRLPTSRTPPTISQAHHRPNSNSTNTGTLTGQRETPRNQRTPLPQHARSPYAGGGPGHLVHRHPPIAPEDPQELLQVLQVMDPPRRRVVIFKGGGYVYADMEAMIQSAGLGHVMRLTNLMRKAHCVVAKERRDTGKRVNLAEHIAGARNANIPCLLIDRLEPEQLVALLRPLLIRKRIVIESPQAARSAAAVSSDAMTSDSSEGSPTGDVLQGGVDD